MSVYQNYSSFSKLFWIASIYISTQFGGQISLGLWVRFLLKFHVRRAGLEGRREKHALRALKKAKNEGPQKFQDPSIYMYMA